MTNLNVKKYNFGVRKLNLKCKEIDQWPKINKKVVESSNIKMVIQINGKTRDVLDVKRGLEEKDVNTLVNNSPKAGKYVLNKEIIKVIFIKNKIINYIIKN